jgi:hypothetical protein
MRKRRIPRGAKMTPDEDEWFEALVTRELGRLPAAAWGERAIGLWLMLPHAYPATRRRLLIRMLEKCRDEGAAPPARLVQMIIRELGVKKFPRSRVADRDKMRAAAEFSARNPGASLAEIAAAAGSPGKKTTILSYKNNLEFQRYRNDELVRTRTDPRIIAYRQAILDLIMKHYRGLGSPVQH